MKRSLTNFYQNNKDKIVFGSKIAGFVLSGVGIAFIGYIAGEALATLKIGKGLSKMSEEEMLFLYEPKRKDIVYDLEEFQCITRYARKL